MYKVCKSVVLETTCWASQLLVYLAFIYRVIEKVALVLICNRSGFNRDSLIIDTPKDIRNHKLLLTYLVEVSM